MVGAADRLTRIWETPGDLVGRLSAVNHKVIGVRFMVTAFVFFLFGGIQALLMRTQLIAPQSDILHPEIYDQLFNMHGTTMMFLFAVPMLEGLAVYFVPLMLGARDMPFPRLNALGYWTFLFGGILLYSSFLGLAAPNSGWFAYVPLTGPAFSPSVNMDFWLLGVTLVEISGIVAALELVALIFRARAPGMSIFRVPIFVWSVLVMAFMVLIAFPAVLTASVLLELDRKVGTRFYDPAAGGDPLLWQHLFWIFGHPEVYIMMLPAVGIVSTILPAFTRVPLVGYIFVVVSTLAIGILSFGVWVHHMFATGLLLIPLAFFSAASHMFGIPSGVQVFAWIATIWRGEVIWRTAFLFVIGFLIIFVLGGITGIMVAVVPFDLQVHDTYFVVAHFHYVIIGGVVFPIFAGVYYWFPKLTGCLLHEGWGKINFWLVFIGFNVTFLPMHLTGLLGMPRRVYTFLPGLGWDELNLISSIGTYIMAIGVLVFIGNLALSYRRGEPSGDNPWGAHTLEWATASPPEPYNFRILPKVASREPLWTEPEQVTRASTDWQRALGERNRRWRETMGTSVLDARAQEIIHLPGPSQLPLFVAGGLLLALVGALTDLVSLFILGLVVGIVSTWLWLWPDREQMEETPGPGDAGLPVAGETSGTGSTLWWGMVLFLLVLADVLVLLAFSYFYLRLNADVWPPAGIAPPNLAIPTVVLGLTVLVAAANYWAYRANRRDSSTHLMLGLAAALLLGLAFGVLQGLDLTRQDFSHQGTAYGSAFFTLVLFQAVLVLVGLGMTAMMLARALYGDFVPRRYLALQNVSLYWGFVALSGATIYAILYLSPYLV